MVAPLSDNPDRFSVGMLLQVEDGTAEVESSRAHKDGLLVKFKGVDDRSRAESLRGKILFASIEELPSAPEGSYWEHQIVGLEVRSIGGTLLGTITEVSIGEAQDRWTVSSGDGTKTLVPAVEEFVKQVNLNEGFVVIDPPEGLFPEEAP